MTLRFRHNQPMNLIRVLGRIFLVSALAFCASKAIGDDSYQSRPLIQADFNRLVPSNYPLATTRFSALKPTTYPVLQPGKASVHITEKLVHPTEKPLLHSN